MAGLGFYDYGACIYSPKLLHTQEFIMDSKGCIGRLVYYGFFMLLPVVGYFLKNKYTTIELFGHQFNTMITIFPIYFILTLIVIWRLNIERKPSQK